MKRKTPLLEYFWSKVEITPSCWLWHGPKHPSGHGSSTHPDYPQHHGTFYAHRLSYELLVGPIPVGLEIDHLCRVRNCVNPLHMELVTHGENVRRGNGGCNHRGKTHCKWGHEYTEENTLRYVNAAGLNGRICRTCKRRIAREWARRKRATT